MVRFMIDRVAYDKESRAYKGSTDCGRYDNKEQAIKEFAKIIVKMIKNGTTKECDNKNILAYEGESTACPHEYLEYYLIQKEY